MCGESSSRAPSRRWRIPFATPLLLLAYLTYLLLGSAAFWALEGPAERDSAHHLLQEKWELLENHTCLNREALERLVKGVVQAYKNGHILRGNASLGRWDYAGSFFFSISAVTTIGGALKAEPPEEDLSHLAFGPKSYSRREYSKDGRQAEMLATFPRPADALLSPKISQSKKKHKRATCKQPLGEMLCWDEEEQLASPC